jgi:phytoene synthase
MNTSMTSSSGGVVDLSIQTVMQAQEVTRRYAKTFYFASHALPPEKRTAAYALYSFCRYVDNLVDETDAPERVAGQLALVRRRLDEIFDKDQWVPRWALLRETINRFGIPKQYFLDLVEGVEMDVTLSRVQTYPELESYCYHVASVVGLMMTCVLQPGDARALPYAADLGSAMQLTNILRDVGEDYARGRIYLPAHELMAFDVHEELFAQNTVTGPFRRFMRFQVRRARELYRKADAGIAMLPNDGSRFCVRLMSNLYSRILNAIEAHDYDVFSRRAHVPLPTKLGVALAVAARRTCSPYFLLSISDREAVRSDALRLTQSLTQKHGSMQLQGGRTER